MRRTTRANRRRRMGTLLGLLVVMSVLPIATGCAHKKAYKKATRLSQEGQYEKAIEELETAIELAEKGNNRKTADRYREELEQTKRRAGQFYYREAELCFGQADLSGAQGFIERSVRCCPTEPLYRSLSQRVATAIGDAERLRAEAMSLAEQGQWNAAVARMKEALRINKTMPGGQGDLKQIQERAYQFYLGRARDRLYGNDLEAAVTEAQTALDYRDDGREAKDVLQAVQDRREAAELIARGRTLLGRGDCEEALRVLEQARQLYAMHPDLASLLQQARQAVCDRWIAQGRQATASGDYATALRLFLKSNDLLPGSAGVTALIAEARATLAKRHLEASQRYAQDAADGCAVFHAVIALGYEPDNYDARSQLSQCIGQVQQAVHYTVGFIGFRASPEQQAIADTLGSISLEHLTRTRPANLTLVERADLQTILDEQQLSATDLVDPQYRVPAGRLRGVDALLVGQVLEAKVTTDTKQTGHGESTYQDGYVPEPNPEYAEAVAVLDHTQRDFDRARQRLAEAEARLARYDHADPHDAAAQAARRRARAEVDEAKQRVVNAATDVGAAQMRVAMTPKEVLVPHMVAFQYPIHTATWTAKVGCMLKMLDAATGEVFLAERIEGQHTQSDQFVSADPARNVPEDPLELPDDTRLLEAAVNNAAGRLKKALDTAAGKHGQRFVIQTQQAEAAGDTAGAVDASIKYLFAYPTSHAEADKRLAALRAYLASEADLVDIRALLRTHCQVLRN
ncbi:MAG: hypothetical protein GXX98_06580 [Planctomycetes bacterium]|nr:hypothetical protein [Planctomycetota bacterium]